MKTTRKVIHAACASLALFFCAPVLAETFTWSNQATGNNNWSAASSWISGNVPASSNTADILFATSARTSPVQDIVNGLTIRSLWFQDVPYTLSGNGLTFDGEFAAIFNNTTATVSNHITLNTTIAYQQNGNITFNGIIDGPGGFIKNGSGALNINTFTLFSGNTDINAGQIVLGHFQGLLSSTVNLNVNNGLNLNGQPAVIGNLAGTGNLSLGGANISVGGNSTSVTYSGQFSATTGSVGKRGLGTWTLTAAGSSMPRFSVDSGRTILSGGSLTVTSTSAINRALVVGSTVGAELDVFAGAVLNTVASGAGSPLIKGINNNTSTMSVAGVGSRWDASQIDVGGSPSSPGVLIADNGGLINATDIFVGRPAGGSLIIQNTSIVNSTHLNVSSDPTDPVPTVALRSGGQSIATETILATPTSSIDVDRGTLHTAMLTSTVGNGSITLRDPFGATALVIDGTSAAATYAGAISGSGGITKNGPSTQTLSGLNTYSGATTVNGGSLILGNGASAAYNANGAGQITLNFGNFGSSSLRVSNGGIIHYPPTVIGGFIRGSNGDHDLKQVTSFNGTTFAVDSAINQDKPLALNNVVNSGNFTNNESLTWDGGVNSSAGIFTVNNRITVSSFENNGLINIQRGGRLTSISTNLTSGGGGRINIDVESQLDVGSLALNLNGSLLVNNGLIRGRTNVNFGALAKGSGEFGEVNVTDGGRFSPGNSPGTVTTASTTWNSGGNYLVEIADSLNASGRDFWHVRGELNLIASVDHPFIVSLASMDGLLFDPGRDYDWTILHADGGIVGLDPAELALDVSGFKTSLAGGHFYLEPTSNDLLVHFSAVPEPSILLLTTVAMFFVFSRRFSRLLLWRH